MTKNNLSCLLTEIMTDESKIAHSEYYKFGIKYDSEIGFFVWCEINNGLKLQDSCDPTGFKIFQFNTILNSYEWEIKNMRVEKFGVKIPDSIMLEHRVTEFWLGIELEQARFLNKNFQSYGIDLIGDNGFWQYSRIRKDCHEVFEILDEQINGQSATDISQKIRFVQLVNQLVGERNCLEFMDFQERKKSRKVFYIVTGQDSPDSSENTLQFENAFEKEECGVLYFKSLKYGSDCIPIEKLVAMEKKE